MDDYLNTVQQRRAEDTETKEKARKHKELLKATEEAGSLIAKTIVVQHGKDRKESAKTKKVTIDNFPNLALRQDVDNLISEVKKLQKEPEKVDFTPLAKAVESLGAKIDQLPKSMPSVDIPDSVVVSNLSDLKSSLDGLKTAVESKDYKPVFKTDVKPTPVNVTVPPIDTSGIEEVLKENEKEEEIELSDFRANDINNDSDAIQYVGLIHPLGYWEIIQFDKQANTLRYKFGKDGYDKAMKNPEQHKYLLLDEAFRELNT